MRFTVFDFHNFKMNDNFPLNDQLHQFQILIQEIHRGSSTLDETYQVVCLIDNYLNYGLILLGVLEKYKKN
jgi:hypothetical protein